MITILFEDWIAPEYLDTIKEIMTMLKPYASDKFVQVVQAAHSPEYFVTNDTQLNYRCKISGAGNADQVLQILSDLEKSKVKAQYESDN